MSTPWVIRKNGMFYRAGSMGYTSSVYEAGHFTEATAKRHAETRGIYAHPLEKFLNDKPDRVRFEEPTVTADEVSAYREDTGASMWEAKAELRRRKMGAAFEKFRAEASLEDKVEFLLDRIEERET